jgi:hypothetical protein
MNNQEIEFIDRLFQLSLDKNSLSELGKSELKKCELWLKSKTNGMRIPLELSE